MKKVIIISILIFILLIFYYIKQPPMYKVNNNLKYPSNFFGVTFSRKFSEKINTNWKKTYLAILDDLGVKYIRIPVYWDDIEKKEGVFDFSDYDFIITEGAKRNVHFIINVGRRLPRWPECHSPVWTKNNSEVENQKHILYMIQKVVKRYRNNENIDIWQVENEPFLDSFGECPHSDKVFLEKEIELIKTLDKRPILLSATGELSFWNREAKLADIFGSTLYRVVWNPTIGYFHYPIPSWFYRFKANLAGIPADKRIIIELQAEPWSLHSKITDLSSKEINKSLSINQFKSNLQYAVRANFSKTYLWGVEWWYWEHKHGNQDYWNLAKTLFK